jgi:uncharacterized cupin superfamily protein
MPRIEIEKIPAQQIASYPREFAAVISGREKQRIGDAAGLTQFGVNVTRIKAGSASALRHWHEQEDEFIYMIEGELVLQENDGETVLKPGDAAGFKAGSGIAHCLINRTQRDAVYLEVGTRAKSERVHYPDVDFLMERDASAISASQASRSKAEATIARISLCRCRRPPADDQRRCAPLDRQSSSASRRTASRRCDRDEKADTRTGRLGAACERAVRVRARRANDKMVPTGGHSRPAAFNPSGTDTVRAAQCLLDWLSAISGWRPNHARRWPHRRHRDLGRTHDCWLPIVRWRSGNWS